MKLWWNWRKRDAELEKEIQHHLRMAEAERVERGASPRDAQAGARREFGNVGLVREVTRDTWGRRWLEDLYQDARFGLRLIRKNPGFAAVAVLTLALGIGANAAIYGLVDAALLNDLPFHQPERLVHLWTTDASGETHTPTPAQYEAVRRYSRTFDSIAGVGLVENFLGDDESGWQTLPGLEVSPNWLTTLGLRPYLGRNFFDEKQAASDDSEVMLSYSCWRSRFHGDRQIIGKQIFLNRRAAKIVGVLPAALSAYSEYSGAQMVSPLVLSTYENSASLRVAGTVRIRIVARLKPGVTLEQSRAETEQIATGLRSPGAPDRSGHLIVEDFEEMVRNPGPTMQNERHGLLLMMAAAGLVLLIACANVAALLLARGVKRQKEVALRSAIGCSRGRMIRQLMTESMLLFLLGAGVGLFAAKWSEELLTKAASGLISSVSYVDISGRVLGFGFAVAAVTALIFGIVPALRLTQVNLNDSLKEGVSKATSGVQLRRPRNLLVVFQVALGMVLMVGFGLLLRSLLHVESSALGFDPRNLMTATVSLPSTQHSDPAAQARMMEAAAGRIRELPGVENAGIVDSLPMDGADSDGLRIETPAAKRPIEQETWFLSVGPDYFSTLGVPMLAGRAFWERDGQNGASVAIVNETFAKTYFPEGNPVGYRVAFTNSPTAWREIVGVVSDFRQRNPEEDLRPLVYLPVGQTLPQRWSVVIRIRTASDVAGTGRDIAKALKAVDPRLYWSVGSMREQIYNSESLTLRRPTITLLASFGGLALLLIVAGVFGVTSYFVAERTREIGVRVALGASGREVMGLVLRETLGVALAGLGLGTVGAIGLARLLPSGTIGWSGSGIFLYGVSRTDALTYSFAAVVLMSVVVMASITPARRAAKVDPVVALRYE